MSSDPARARIQTVTTAAPELPYRDTKPQGAADFYYAINATFRFVLERFGHAGWRDYLTELGRGYYAPANRRWRTDGLPGVARYWRAFFAAEPNAEVDVQEEGDRVELRVKRCPAIAHLKSGGRDIVREYCQHCYFLGCARAEAAGFQMRLSGGNGTCLHVFASGEAKLPPQDMAQIREVTP